MDVPDDMESCYILFSTQSGRAKACARRCARIIREQTGTQVKNGTGSTFDDAVHDIFDWCEMLRSSKFFLLLFVSTTGDGEHTDTIQRTWKLLLQKSLPSNLFRGIRFAIFNLGDRAYGQSFCAAGRKLAVRLLQLGAKLVGEPGYGDDGTPNGGVFADLDVWVEAVLLNLFGKIPAAEDNGVSASSSVKLQSPYHVTVCDPSPETSPQSGEEEWQQEIYRESYQCFFQRICPLTAYRYDGPSLDQANRDNSTSPPPLLAHVVENRRITAEDWEQNTRHIRLEIDSATAGRPVTGEVGALPYRAGDVASVIPSNSPEEVERFLRVLPNSIQELADCELCLDYDGSIEATAGVGFASWPTRCTLRGWLAFCADIHALPEREDLRALSHFCSMDHPHGLDQQRKLKALSETSGSALYADYILREKRSWWEVLYDFDSICADGSSMTIDLLVSLLSPIRPRDFSIASSPSEEHVDGNSVSSARSQEFNVELCVAVVEGTTPLGRNYHGLCSMYLSRLVPQETEADKSPVVRLWIRPGSFHGLSVATTVRNGNHRMESPVLCVGAGTGIAPLRGLIREREAVRLQKTKDSSPLAAVDELDRDNLLVFGCRKQAADFYYNSEWEELTELGRLGLLTAFSREQWHKIYVQQVLEKAEAEHKLVSRHLLENNGSICIAGGPKMARAVKDVIVEALGKQMEGGEKQALLFLSKLQRQGRLSIEAWG